MRCAQMYNLTLTIARKKSHICCYGLVLGVFQKVSVINQTNCILFIGQLESRDQQLVISYLSRVKVSDRKIYVAQLTNQIACYIVRWRECQILFKWLFFLKTCHSAIYRNPCIIFSSWKLGKIMSFRKTSRVESIISIYPRLDIYATFCYLCLVVKYQQVHFRSYIHKRRSR